MQYTMELTKAKAYGLKAKGQLLKGMQWHAFTHDSIITFMQKPCDALEILDEVKAKFGLKIWLPLDLVMIIKKIECVDSFHEYLGPRAHLCWLLSLKWLLNFEHIVQYLYKHIL